MIRIRLTVALTAAGLALGLSSALALEMMTYSYMDKNRDGKVTMKEWTSSSTSFKARDYNNDGVLTGDELRVTYKGKKENLSFQETLNMRFEELDVNNDNIISTWEWPSQRRYFDQLDDNGDRTLTRVEFRDRKDETLDAFSTLDKNRNGVLSKKESQLSDNAFNQLDTNRDGQLTRNEYYDKVASVPPPTNNFDALDRNKDGILSPFEWQGSKSDFDAADTDNNRVITVIEFNNRSRASRPGMK
ncbi:MAG TPA: hypothetical protein VJR29_12735 [bacterium]|nr:hypothetical protein [bacterium]